MPDEDRDQDRDEDDDNDAYGSRSAPTAIVDYNRAISHTSHCSFRSSARFIPRVQASVPGGGEASGMWLWSGFVLSLVLAAVALWRSRAKSRSYYEGEVYGETAQTHRRWAFAFGLLALALAATTAWSPAGGAAARGPRPYGRAVRGDVRARRRRGRRVT
jgi:hypothetical protein